MESIQIKIQHIENNFSDIQLPDYATEGSSGLDLRGS